MNTYRVGLVLGSYSSLAWGVLCAVSNVEPAFNDISFAILIATAGLTCGGAALYKAKPQGKNRVVYRNLT